MGKPTFLACIDESGDEGFKFDAGSSEWFVLSGIIFKHADELAQVKLVDEVRLLLNRPPKKPLHFRDMRHEHRLPYVERIANADLRIVSVLVHKPSLLEPEKFTQQYRLYFYAARYLLERISWYCRDHKSPHDPGDGSVELVFSNRSAMPYESLKEYLKLLRDNSEAWGVTIDWNVVFCDQAMSLTPGKRMGLQIADAVASGIFYAVQPSQYGFTEDRYLRTILPRFYRYKGGIWGYGLKIWPRDAELLRSDGKILEGIK